MKNCFGLAMQLCGLWSLYFYWASVKFLNCNATSKLFLNTCLTSTCDIFTKQTIPLTKTTLILTDSYVLLVRFLGVAKNCQYHGNRRWYGKQWFRYIKMLEGCSHLCLCSMESHYHFFLYTIDQSLYKACKP